MIASLPMYNQPDCLPALDRYWALIRDALRKAGLAAPDGLTWDMPDYLDHWQRPDLVLSQACGYPYRAVLHNRVTLIGTPDFGVDGCAPGHYRSVFVVRQDDPRRDLPAFAQARFAYNDALSQSGWAAPQTHVAQRGFQFGAVLQTGSHALSARAVLTGGADIAAIDAVTWRFLHCDDPALSGLRILDQTEPTPGLPYIAARGVDRSVVYAAIDAAIQALGPENRAVLGLKGIVEIEAAAYLAVPNPAPPDQIAHKE